MNLQCGDVIIILHGIELYLGLCVLNLGLY